MCCHSHVHGKNDFSQAVAALLEADAASPASWLDYLVVETSGVMDPAPLIATLDQRWGVMHKVHLLISGFALMHQPQVKLESVLAVVDTAAVVEQLEGGQVNRALQRQVL